MWNTWKFGSAAIFFLLCLLAASMATPSRAADPGPARQQRFVDHHDGTVTDTRTGLMWATSDNGADIQWWDADLYCKASRAGGYTDWRLPTPRELATLYDPAWKKTTPYGIAPVLHLSDRCPWTSTTNLNAAVCFSFVTGKKVWARRNDSFQLRVLPVRGPRDASEEEH
ncbi:MAG TPA: DUF1566 domain-containing protein [Desulfobulbus sp.]|nr:DUF1566 domain-containing protein [Desulfobulbus sp.]